MPMLIRELVNVDSHGEFVPAVQLRDFDNPEKNLLLTRSFIFTAHAPHRMGLSDRYYSSLEMLVKLKDVFIQSSDNVIMMIADYGHGKSHLGLQAMNYFGHPINSQPFEALIGRVSGAAEKSPATVTNLRDFRDNREKFLVLHMAGDGDKSIREMFYTALIKELKRHNALDSVQLPFWNNSAVSWLSEQKNNPKVIEYLGEEHGTDIDTLIGAVEKNMDGSWEQYVGVFKKVNHAAPDATSHKNPQEMIDWIMDVLVGEGKPFTGLTVFFDEFSQFLRLYTLKGNDQDLPELLHGIADHKGKALLLLLGHHDPEKTIGEATSNTTRLDSMKKHLTRLQQKWLLFTVVESVLDSFLANSREAWEQLRRESPTAVGGILGTNADDSHEYFKHRYKDELDWDYERFQEVVVKGCFPLHPTTTALMSSLPLNADKPSEARSMLRFIREVYDARKDMPILENNRVSWVLPFELVDFFKDSLTSDLLYNQYLTAERLTRKNLGDEADSADASLIKALLLQSVAKFDKLRGSRQIDLLSHFTGLSGGVTLTKLQALEQKNVIDLNPITKQYGLREVSGGADVMDEIEKRSSGRIFDLKNTIKLTNLLESKLQLSAFQDLEISVDWGHSNEWRVKQTVMTRANFDAATLKKLVPPFAFGPSNPKLENKGALVWCLPANEADLDYFRQEAGKILAEAFGDGAAAPIFIMIPDQPASGIVTGFYLLEAANEMLVSPEMVQKYTDVVIRKELDKLTQRLKRELEGHFKGLRMTDQVNQKFFVPPAYAAQFSRLDGRSRSFGSIFQRLFKLSYGIAPPSFFQDIKGFNSTTVNTSAKKISTHLAANNLHLLMRDGAPSHVDKRLVNDYLIPDWGLVSRTFAVIEPSDPTLKKVWKEFDDHFVIDRGEFKVGPILQKLVNVPYGFDPNTTWLLFSAWLGARRGGVKIYKQGRNVRLRDVMDQINSRGPLVTNLNKLIVEGRMTVSREDQGEIEKEVLAIIENVHTGSKFTEGEAKNDITMLENFVSRDEGSSQANDARNALDALKIGLKDKTEYDEKWARLDQRLQRAKPLDAIVSLIHDIKELNEPILVASNLSIIVLNEKIHAKIKSELDNLMTEATTFKNIEDTGLMRERLRHAASAVKGNSDWALRIDKTTKAFEEHVIDLTTGRDTDAILAQIKAASVDGQRLVVARDNRESLRSMKVPEKLSSDKEQAISKLTAAIYNLEGFANRSIEIYTKIEEGQLPGFRRSVLQKAQLFTGSEFESSFDEMSEYVDQLEGYFSGLRRVKEYPTEHYRTVCNGLEKLAEADQKYSDVLSDDHLIALNELKHRLNVRKDKLAEEVAMELSKIESVLSIELDNISGTLDIVRYRTQLSSIAQKGLNELEQRVERAKKNLDTIEQVMNSDHAMDQIVRMFKGLNANDRETVLEALKKI